MLEHNQHVDPDQLSAYLRGELDPHTEARIEEHIGSCLVCARRLREEAQLEMLLLEAHECANDVVEVATVALAAEPRQTGRRGRGWWQRVAGTVANSAAAAAAMFLVIAPGQPLNSHGVVPSGAAVNDTVSAAGFLNDALCFPSAAPEIADEDCDDAVTDPDDYLSPFDGELVAFSGVTSEARAATANVCLVEDLACEPG